MAVQLVQAAAELTKQKLILIPLLEDNATHTEEEQIEVVTRLMPAIRESEKLGVRIGFETEMDVNKLRSFLDRFQSRAVGVYYDIGNCTSYGFNCPADLRALGSLIFGVHIKDRKVKSAQSMMLGAGDANIAGCVIALQEIGFKGIPIMQAWRGENYKQDAKNQLHFLQQLAS